MNVVLLTEGTHKTGYGHLTRCLSIYQAFEEKGIKPVYVANCDDRGKEILRGVHFVCFNWLVEREKLLEIVNGADLLVIDSYLATRSIYLELSSRVGKAAYIDDYQRIEYPNGIIINGTIDAENLGYNTDSQHEMLLGVRYVPIRREFWEVPTKTNKDTVQDILITFGGHDKRDITFSVLDLMLHEFKEMKYTVVMGGGFESNSVKKYSKEKNIKLFHSLTAASMLDLMLSCDIAISAAGQTLYELARVGVPTIAVGVVQNQQHNLIGWVKNRFIINPLWFDDRDFNKKLVSSFTSTMMKKHREIILKTLPTLVDGQGARRIVSRIWALVHMEDIGNLEIRAANSSDAKIIFDSSNDDLVRRNSINEDVISWESHLEWFHKKLQDDNYLIYLIFSEDKFVGQTKFEIDKIDAVISISINAAFRGKKIGSHILKLTSEKLFQEHKDIKNILAYIKPENIPSIRSFQNAGFMVADHDIIINQKPYLIFVKKSGDSKIL